MIPAARFDSTVCEANPILIAILVSTPWTISDQNLVTSLA